MKKSIGTISLGEISFLSDSCYGTYSDLNTTIKTKPGEYKVYVTYCEDKNDFLDTCIMDIYTLFYGVGDLWSHMERREYEHKTQLC
jgi:hypothetical protein